jgi:hypothetical protein
MVAEQSRDNRTLKELLAKKLLTPTTRKEAVTYAVINLGRSVRKALAPGNTLKRQGGL